jgi:hypothetical protein
MMKTQHNYDAERGVLCALLSDVDPLPAFQALTAKDFFHRFHSRVFVCLRSMHENGEAFQVATVQQKMNLDGVEAAELGKLMDVMLRADTDKALRGYLRTVKRFSRVRELQHSCQKLIELNGDDATGLISDIVSKGTNFIDSLREGPDTPGVLASTIVPKKVGWFWAGRIPLGKPSVLDGDPDNAKSLISTDLAARTTSGKPMPDGSVCPHGGAVILANEDDDQDTIVPRLIAAGAELDLVRLLRDVETKEGKRQLEIPEDIDVIRRAALSVHATLIVIDPLFAFIPTKTNTWSDQHVRRALAPLAELARELNCAILVIRHLNKANDQNPLHRGGGSMGIVAQARSGMLAGPDPADETGEIRVLAMTKHNLARKSPSLRYRVVVVDDSIAIEWMGECDVTSRSLLAAPEGEDRSKADECARFLRGYLEDGAQPANEVVNTAKKNGFSERTIDRAKVLAAIKPYRQGFGKEGKWMWNIVTT